MKNKGLYFYFLFLFVLAILLLLFVLLAYIFFKLPLWIVMPSLLFCTSGVVVMLIPLDTLRKGIKAVSVGDLTRTQVLLLAAGCILAGLGFISLLFMPQKGIVMKLLFLSGFLYLVLKAINLLFRAYKQDSGNTSH